MVRGREKSSPYIQKRTKIFCNVPKSIYICNQNDKSDGKIRSFVYDRLTSFDLVKSGKFTLGYQKLFSQVSHVPFEGHGLLFYHLFDTRYFPEPN